MKTISPTQKRQLRKQAAFATELWRTQRSLVDHRHDKVERLTQAKMDLRKLEARAQAGGDTLPQIAACRETIAELEEDIRSLDVRIGEASADFGAASRFIEQLLAYSGQEHDDFPEYGSGRVRFG